MKVFLAILLNFFPQVTKQLCFHFELPKQRTEFEDIELCFSLKQSIGVLCRAAAGFPPWRVCPHQVRLHVNSTSNQVLKIYLSLTEKKRQDCAYEETKPHKTCLFLIL